MRVVAFAGLVALLGLTGCPSVGVVCRAGTVPCGSGCVDPNADQRNCGGCGLACANNETCNAGSCQCQAGTTSCNGTCVVLDYDARNCGSCGNVCTGGVCEASSCREACTLGVSVACGGACVNPNTDARHCGGCNQPCAQGQSCRAGACTFDVVAACYGTGQVVGFNAQTLTRGALTSVGTNPGALAVTGDTVLVADGSDQRLYQLKVTRAGLTLANLANPLGATPNQILVDGQVLYVANASSGTLQVLHPVASGGDSVALDAGTAEALRLTTATELQLGMNSFPEAAVKVGANLWVALFGGGANVNQAVVKVSVANALVPAEVSRFDLGALDLHSFDGGQAIPRAFAITSHQGAVYAVLSNLGPDWKAAGPGMLARIDPDAGALSSVNLGSDCLDPVWAAPVGTKLAVSCFGHLSDDFRSTDHAGLALLDENDAVIGRWSAACPAMTDGGTCPAMEPGRFTVRGNRVFLADQNAGRVVVLDATDAGLVEVRGVADALVTCPLSGTGFGNVSDLVSLP